MALFLFNVLMHILFQVCWKKFHTVGFKLVLVLVLDQLMVPMLVVELVIILVVMLVMILVVMVVMLRLKRRR